MLVVERVKELKIKNELNFGKRLELKESGRPLPKDVHYNFRKSMYDLSDWICRCEVNNAFYYF